MRGMGRLLYFYPENDMALAVGSPGYTAPEQAARLRLSGEALPLWYGQGGDRVLTSGISAAWYDRMQRDFGIEADVFDFDCTGLCPEPWGWSAAVRNIFAAQGVAADAMPNNETLARIRDLSSRRTSINISAQLTEQLPFMTSTGAVAITDAADLAEVLARRGHILVKQPWSSSGRGVIDNQNMTDADVIRQASGIIRRQGCAIVENVVVRRADFALLFKNTPNGIIFSGLSLFNTDHRYCYAGNIVAEQSVLRDRLTQLVAAEQLDALVNALERILTDTIGDAYYGPLGVDMMLTDKGIAVAEMNLRNTMGHVCLALGERYMAPGLTGAFSVVPVVSEQPTYTVCNQRLTSGTVSLTPGRFFSFLLSV